MQSDMKAESSNKTGPELLNKEAEDAQQVRSHELPPAWNRFWFEPASPLSLCLFRIVFGALMFINLVCTYATVYPFFFCKNAVYPKEIVATYVWKTGNPVFDVLWFVPDADAWHYGVLWFAIIMSVCLTCGIATRFSTIAFFLCLLSFNNHFPMVLHAGDNFARLISLFLCFSPCGARLSVDALIARYIFQRQGAATPDKKVRLYEPWAQRLIQVQLCFIYLVNVIYKAAGTQWIDGSAVYYATRLLEFHRNNLPSFLDSPISYQIMTWLTVPVELAFVFLLWPRATRYVVMVTAVLFHLCLEYCFNLGVFEWVFISVQILFIYPEDIERFLKALPFAHFNAAKTQAK